jgi:regulator of protease activity HflC (stomatin/prohibitin superfamily)
MSTTNYFTLSRILKRGAGIIVAVLVLTNFPVVTIKSTERGIVYRWSEVQETVLEDWLHIIMPFADEVRKVNITPSQLDINVPVGNQGAITRDNQTIGADMVVFYRFKESELINIAKNYGYDVLTSKIQKDVNESFKQVIGQYTIFDVAVKQEDIRQEMISGARLKLGDYPIVIEDVKVSNYDWSDEFDKQIATTMTIAQETKQQEQELKKVEITAQKKVKEAEANRQAEVLNAEAMKVKGEGIRDYNAAITANPRNMELEIKLKQLEIEKLRVERWNGQYVPVNHYWPIPVSFAGQQGE